MPHVKLEHTENMTPSKIKPIFNQLINILIENALVKKENCKCRAIQISVYDTGNNDSDHYYHLEISLLKGRSKEIRQKIGQMSLESLKYYFADNDIKNNKQFSVEIREMNPKNYFTSNIL